MADDLHTSIVDHVGLIEIDRPPHNYFDHNLMHRIATTLAEFAESAEVRAVVLASTGSAFSAGGRHGREGDTSDDRETRGSDKFHTIAIRLFQFDKPMVAAVHGSAVGGGLGLALAADLRVTCPEAKFSANFNRLGFHPGFGLTVTLPRLVGQSKAALMMYTGRRLGGEEAFNIGLADVLVARDEVRRAALDLANEIAVSAPLAVLATRATLRAGFAEQVARAMDRESEQQSRLRLTADFREGVAAFAERRMPVFHGR